MDQSLARGGMKQKTKVSRQRAGIVCRHLMNSDIFTGTPLLRIASTNI